MNIKVHQIGRFVALIGLGVGSLLPSQSAFADTYRRPQVIQQRPRVIPQQSRVIQQRPRVTQQRPRVTQQPRVVLKKPRVILDKKSQVVHQQPRITLNNKSQVILNKRSRVIQRRPQVVLRKTTNYYPHNIYQQPTSYHPYVIYQQPIYQQPSVVYQQPRVIYQQPSYRQPDVIYQRSTKLTDTSKQQLEISIRYAHSEDVEQIHRVLFTSVRTLCAKDYTPEQIEAWVGKLDLETSRNDVGKDAKILLVAEDNEGVIVGFASLNKGEVNAVYVHPYYSWQDVSALLLDAVKAEAMTQNVENLMVSASTTAVPFYQEQGYKVVKQSSHNLGSGVQIPCVHMEQALLQPENP